LKTWLIIACVSAVTYVLRAAFIVFADPHKFPHAFRQALRFVPPAVLAAIVAPGLLLAGGVIDPSPRNARLLAGLVALAVAARWRHPLAPIAAGMPALWLLQWAMG
jgi:branched-subunit amino acid transport protein